MAKDDPSGTEPSPDPDEEQDRFVNDVLTRGEAAEEGDELRPGQTHEVVKDDDGRVHLRRRRFGLTS